MTSDERKALIKESIRENGDRAALALLAKKLPITTVRKLLAVLTEAEQEQQQTKETT